MIAIVIIVAVAVIPLLNFMRDFCDAVYYKDYHRIEKYISDPIQFAFDDEVVSIKYDVNMETVRYTLYITDRQYTRPKLVGIDYTDMFNLQLFYGTIVTWDNNEGGYGSMRVEISRSGLFSYKITYYDSQ